ncbi:MAG: tetratricopeptide repeat protein [Acidobacteria bacterium]|nr:tetratricopeptide repeat protein [Acidobacteriota bacterium]NIM61723.1 tetratricopeptide repeat protein [Acidobacteriota bacterium]NIO58903.1 tetratricopeptide repeat protein [Acidobacteriota bacterium]NIQ29957.1 tetratricopeptide repeat protein [Acidobacteriota bacterium]NIQ84690.1 tetratricopeptide repeat protein [Acidobacteriota bacterium]
MKGYSVKDVARMLDLSVGQVRSYARSGLVAPDRGQRGEYRFGFQDLVLLRTAKGLLSQRIPPQRVRTALNRLKQQLPADGSLSSVQISAHGSRIVVQRSGRAWQPESGQTLLAFEGAPGEALNRPIVEPPERQSPGLDAEDWFRLGGELELGAPEQAREAYRRALELEPRHVDARINLGRLLHESGEWEAAEKHYRMALADRVDDSTALFNLAVVLEDLGRRRDAIDTYRATVEADPEYADAYFNLARLLEQSGDTKSALRYLKIYRDLTAE